MTLNFLCDIVKVPERVKISNVLPSFVLLELDFAAKNGTSRAFVELDCTACPRNAKQFELFTGGAVMAVPFVSRKRLNPRDLEAEGKFYP
ncbi:MAG: hypothetical protein II631_00325, partial [Treponema sp.]|nr:hypothetical protein [Treponema sp.]